MGYTNYWTLANKIDNNAKKAMVVFTKKCIELSGVKICNWGGNGKPTINTKKINFNGTKENDLSHENFNIYDSNWLCCKTNRKPYDVVVKAVLMYAEKLGVVTEWSFDGDETEIEYIDAKKLFLKTLMDQHL